MTLRLPARQAEDRTLYETVVRIQARAIRRCRELLRSILAQIGGARAGAGRPALTDGAATEATVHQGTADSRSQAARDAGLSDRQRKTALRVANIPATTFDTAVEEVR